MPYRTILIEHAERVAFITLSRPQQGNFLDEEMAAELRQACLHLEQAEGIWAVIVGGAGENFCSGGDRSGAEAVAAVAALERPTIAALQGDVLEMGLALALACDLRVADESARLGVPRFPPHPAGLTQRLPRLVGRGRALHMLLLGDTLTPQEALGWGLVNRVVPRGEARKAAAEIASAIASKAPIAARFAREAVHKGMDITLAQGLRLEADLYFLLHTTSDRTEGVKAFLEKRKPRFTGT